MSAPTYEVGGYRNITATGNLSPVPGAILGVLCSTTTAGTIQFYDSATNTTTTPITGVITPAAGSFTPIKAFAANGVYAVITGTLNATVVIA
jgi:hypothetical protein